MGILDKLKNKKTDDDAPNKAKDLKVEEKPKAEKAKQEKPKQAVEKVQEETVVKEDMADRNIAKYAGILIRPMVSEKNSGLTKHNQFVFEISTKANKIQVAEAIKAKYGVEPVRVNVSNIIGKKVRYGKYTGKQKDSRKAIVFLPEGKSINVYEGA
ncbi:MAG: 50S ribosomal protein L23 [Candidatus Buchananbacteria bacterium]